MFDQDLLQRSLRIATNNCRQDHGIKSRAKGSVTRSRIDFFQGLLLRSRGLNTPLRNVLFGLGILNLDGYWPHREGDRSSHGAAIRQSTSINLMKPDVRGCESPHLPCCLATSQPDHPQMLTRCGWGASTRRYTHRLGVQLRMRYQGCRVDLARMVETGARGSLDNGCPRQFLCAFWRSETRL